MKKPLTIVLVLAVALLSVFSFTSCKKKNSDATGTVTDSIVIAVPDGGPSLGISYLLKKYPTKIDNTKVEYKIVSGAAGIRTAVVSGEADMAIMPTNLAANLYNKGEEIRVVGTNSYGLLYLLSNTVTANTFTYRALEGQVLHTVGQSGTPEAVLKKILTANGLEWVESDTPVAGKVALNFHEQGSTIIQGLKMGNINFAVLGEPAVSNALQKVSGSLSIVADLQLEWMGATDTDASYPQTCLVAKKSLIESDPVLVKMVAEFTLEGSRALLEDPQTYVTALQEVDIEEGVTTVPQNFDEAGVRRTHITPAFGDVAKQDIVNYLTILLEFNPSLIGGKLPDDGFYYDPQIKG